MNDPLRNPKDPIRQFGPDAGQQLFREFSRVANGFPTQAALEASVNMLVNAIRQGTPDWQKAEIAFDEFFGRAKQLLKNHYDMNGRKKGIFPYNQVLLPPFHDDKDTPYHRR